MYCSSAVRILSLAQWTSHLIESSLFEKCTWNYHVNGWAWNTKSNENETHRRFHSIVCFFFLWKGFSWYSKRIKLLEERIPRDASTCTFLPLSLWLSGFCSPKISFRCFEIEYLHWISPSLSVKCFLLHNSNQICALLHPMVLNWFELGAIITNVHGTTRE